MIIHHTAITEILSNGKKAKSMLWKLDNMNGKRCLASPLCVAQSIVDLARLAGSPTSTITPLVNNYLVDLKCHTTVISSDHVKFAAAFQSKFPALSLNDCFVFSIAQALLMEPELIACTDKRFVECLRSQPA